MNASWAAEVEGVLVRASATTADGKASTGGDHLPLLCRQPHKGCAGVHGLVWQCMASNASAAKHAAKQRPSTCRTVDPRIQLHTGRDAAAVAAASRDRTEVHWSDTGGAVQLPYALPSAAPPAVPPLLLGHAQPPFKTEEGAVDAAAAAAVQQAAERELAEAEVREEYLVSTLTSAGNATVSLLLAVAGGLSQAG